jgi:hypothetical protein
VGDVAVGQRGQQLLLDGGAARGVDRPPLAKARQAVGRGDDLAHVGVVEVRGAEEHRPPTVGGGRVGGLD